MVACPHCNCDIIGKRHFYVFLTMVSRAFCFRCHREW